VYDEQKAKTSSGWLVAPDLTGDWLLLVEYATSSEVLSPWAQPQDSGLELRIAFKKDLFCRKHLMV